MKRKARPAADRVTGELWNHIVYRDGGCVAPMLDIDSDLCRTLAGDVYPRNFLPMLTVDHVHDAATMGKRAPSDAAHLVCLCIHHNDNGWASAHREDERAYLARLAKTGRL